jgi:hypothetical protein
VILDYVKTLLPINIKVSPSGWHTLNCPVCIHNGQSRPDTRKRGGFNFPNSDSVVYHCFNCGFKTSWLPGRKITSKFRILLTSLGATDNDIKKLVLASMQIQSTSERVTFDSLAIPGQWKEEALPINSKPLLKCTITDAFTKALKYLEKRSLMDAGNWYYTDTKAFNLDERVILPFEYNNKIVGYTARLTKRPKSNSIPKYITKSPQSFLFNYDKQTNVKYTIVCEGPFDALMVNGVAVCGNHCNSRQIDLLNHLPTKKIVVPDKDGKDSNLMDVAIENKWHISLPEWPNEVKDICDAVAYYGRLEALLTILYAKEYNKIKIKIKQKKWLR